MSARVLVVDDDHAVRRSLADILGTSFRVETFATPAALLQGLDLRDVGCIVADVRMPEMTGLELLDMLARRGGGPPVVMITGHGDIPTAVRAIKAGATEFIEKPHTADEILNAVRAAVALPVEPAPTASEAGTEFLRRLDDLTPRQRETFELIIEGHTNASAALCLGISPRTVEAHRASIMEKTGATSLAELVRRSIEVAP